MQSLEHQMFHYAISQSVASYVISQISEGSVMYIKTEGNASFTNNIIEFTSTKSNSSTIYYTSASEKTTIFLDGGCYNKEETSSAFSSHFMVIDLNTNIEFKSKPCFQSSKEESFSFEKRDLTNSIPDEYFNCHECDSIEIVPPSFPSGDDYYTPTYDTNASYTEDVGGDDTHTKKKGLSTGAIVGIAITVVIVVVAIILFILFVFIRKKSIRHDIKSKQISQEVDTGIYSLSGNTQSEVTNTDNPIWAATNDGNTKENEDPFMKSSEEGMI